LKLKVKKVLIKVLVLNNQLLNKKLKLKQRSQCGCAQRSCIFKGKYIQLFYQVWKE